MKPDPSASLPIAEALKRYYLTVIVGSSKYRASPASVAPVRFMSSCVHVWPKTAHLGELGERRDAVPAAQIAGGTVAVAAAADLPDPGPEEDVAQASTQKARQVPMRILLNTRYMLDPTTQRLQASQPRNRLQSLMSL